MIVLVQPVVRKETRIKPWGLLVSGTVIDAGYTLVNEIDPTVLYFRVLLSGKIYFKQIHMPINI